MSVGAGSIKRAAKAANSTEELKQTAGGPVETAAEKTESKPEGTKAAKKTKSATGASAKTAKKTKTQKTAAKKTAASKGSKQNASNKKKSAAPAKYEAYGVGQELPVHLM